MCVPLGINLSLSLCVYLCGCVCVCACMHTSVNTLGSRGTNILLFYHVTSEERT